MSNTGSLGLRLCPAPKHSVASAAPIFNRCAMKSPVSQHLNGRCAGLGSAFITRLSSLLRKRAQGVSDVVLKPPGATGTAWPLCPGAAPAAPKPIHPRELGPGGFLPRAA